MKLSRSFCAQIGLLLLVGGGLALNVSHALEIVLLNRPQIGGDAATLHEERFAGLKGLLPPGTTVGYISDEKIMLTSIDSIREFALTQYDLAPVFVDQTTQHELVVGNFIHKRSGFELPDDAQWTVLRDMGNGVILIRRQPK